MPSNPKHLIGIDIVPNIPGEPRVTVLFEWSSAALKELSKALPNGTRVDNDSLGALGEWMQNNKLTSATVLGLGSRSRNPLFELLGRYANTGSTFRNVRRESSPSQAPAPRAGRPRQRRRRR